MRKKSMSAQEFLEDTIRYYSKDPVKRRSVNQKLGNCSYNPVNAGSLSY